MLPPKRVPSYVSQAAGDARRWPPFPKDAKLEAAQVIMRCTGVLCPLKAQLLLLGLFAFLALFVFSAYVAFPLCGYCFANPNAVSPGGGPFMPPHSRYWNVDGKYAAVALAGIFTFGFLWRRMRQPLLVSVLFAWRMLFGVVLAYEVALIFFDRPALYIHATNFEMQYPWLSWVTNYDVLLASAVALAFGLLVGWALPQNQVRPREAPA